MAERAPGSSSATPRDDEGSEVGSVESRYPAPEGPDPDGPLRASWHPVADVEEDRKPDQQASTVQRLITGYGGSAFAVLILLVITALVVFDTAWEFDQRDDNPDLSGSTESNLVAPRSPAVSENPVEQVELNIPTAKLPSGGAYTESGEGTWHVVPGQGEKVGESGELYTYTVEVEDGIDPASYAGDTSFARAVEEALSDPRGWTWDGDVSLQRVDADFPDPDFRVSLTTSATTRKPEVCGGTIPFETSCYRRDMEEGNRVIINLARWVRGALAFSGDMTSYRQYLVNHEVGHALGLGHVGCPEDDALAPVMMQQSFGVANDYVAELNNVPGGDQDAVPADGKTCKPNAWPNPQAGSE